MASLTAAAQVSRLSNPFLGSQAEVPGGQRSCTVLPQGILKAATMSAHNSSSSRSMTTSKNLNPAMSRREIFVLSASLAGATLLNFSGNTKTALALEDLNKITALALEDLSSITTPAFKKLDLEARKYLKGVIGLLDAGVWLRLAFHDLGDYEQGRGGGPNGSVLSDKELKSRANESFVPWDVTGRVNSWREEISRRAGIPISNADVIQLAGAVAVEVTGGPFIPIPLGRPDMEGTGVDPLTVLYNPGMNYPQIKAGFDKKGLTTEDLVALIGAHTIGFIGATNLASRTKATRIDMETPLKFDNRFFKQIQAGKFKIPSDGALLEDPIAKSYVDKFASDQQAFFKSFKIAYAKMSVVGLKFMQGPPPPTSRV